MLATDLHVWILCNFAAKVGKAWLEKELKDIELYWNSQPRTLSMYHGQPPPPSEDGSVADTHFFDRNYPLKEREKGWQVPLLVV